MRLDGGILMSNPFLLAITVIAASGAATAVVALIQGYRESSERRSLESGKRLRVELERHSDRKSAVDVKARISIGETTIEFSGDNVDDLMDVLSSWIENNREIRNRTIHGAETKDPS
jgi:hypothetical protein